MPEPNSQPDNSDNWLQVTEEDPRKRKELEAVYARLFKPGSDAFVVLGDLNQRYLLNHNESTWNHSFFAGQAEVMKYIQAMIQKGKE